MNLLKKLNPVNERFRVVELASEDNNIEYHLTMLKFLGKSVLRGGVVGFGLGSLGYIITGQKELPALGAVAFGGIDLIINELRAIGLVGMRRRNVREYENHKNKILSYYNQ